MYLFFQALWQPEQKRGKSCKQLLVCGKTGNDKKIPEKMRKERRMKIYIRGEYIIPNTPEGRELADEFCYNLQQKGMLKDRKEDTTKIIVFVETSTEMFKRTEGKEE